MSISRLDNLIRFFKGESGDKDTLLEELFLTVLGRATSSDTNIEATEIETVQALYKEAFGKEVEAGEVRHAAHSEIFEKTPLISYVKSASKQLSGDDKKLICSSLQKVMQIDGRVSPKEVDFFNDVVGALGATPAELVGLGD